MNETERLFDKDSRLTSFTGTVISCEKDRGSYRVILDRTAFFPEEGGQSCDCGTLAGVPISRVKEKDGVICHWLQTPLEPGSQAEGRIDWEKRFSDMQQHSGEHIVSGLMHSIFGFDNVGFHLGSDYVTMDFNGIIDEKQLRMIEEKANEAAVLDIPILVSYPTAQELEIIPYRSKKELDGRVRIVEIPGYDICACCAPHVRTTGEIGIIKLTDMEKYKGGIRVYMLCGYRALADYNEKEKSVADISALLSARPDRVSAAAAKQKEEVTGLRLSVNLLKMDIIKLRISQIPETAADVCLFDEHLDKTNNRHAWTMMTERFSGLCGSFAGDDDSGYQFVLGGRDIDALKWGKIISSELGGKGGGSAEMYQGRLSSSKAEIEKWFSDIRRKQ